LCFLAGCCAIFWALNPTGHESAALRSSKRVAIFNGSPAIVRPISPYQVPAADLSRDSPFAFLKGCFEAAASRAKEVFERTREDKRKFFVGVDATVLAELAK
jgi:hypothetical protein